MGAVVGAGVAVGLGVAVGAAVGLGVGASEADGIGVADGSGVADGAGLGEMIGSFVGRAVTSIVTAPVDPGTIATGTRLSQTDSPSTIAAFAT